MVCQRNGFLVVGIMRFFHCPGSNGTTTCYCRETDNVANTRFLGHFCTPTMLHLRAFVANQVLSPIRTYFGLFCPDFYSDIADFTQILCRYLPKKLVAKTSVIHINKGEIRETLWKQSINHSSTGVNISCLLRIFRQLSISSGRTILPNRALQYR